MTIDKQSLIDAALALVGGILGGAAVGAFYIHRYLHTPVNSAPRGSDEHL